MDLKYVSVVWASEVTTSSGADDDWLLLIAEQLQARTLEERAAGPMLHDVNNVMTALLYEVNVILERTRRGEDCLRALERVQAALASAATITRGFAWVGRAERGNVPVVDVCERLVDLQSVLGVMSGEGIGLNLDIPPRLPCATIRPEVFDRVLLNLVCNAADAIVGQGEVWVRAQSLAVAETMASEAGAPRPGGYVVVTVEDDGRGMSAATAACAFTPTFTTKAEGSGIGLPLVARMVQRAGGRVGIRSLEGVGTAVKVYLPAMS